MNREPKTPPLKTWQIFSAGFFHLKKDWLTQQFGVSQRAVERWAADPDTTDSHARNPLDRVEAMLRRFIEVGKIEFAKIIAQRFALIVGCELVEIEEVVPDKDDIQAECLDDYPALVRMHEAIRNNDDIETVRHHVSAVKRELDETFVCYKQKRISERQES